jgi:uncharacterized protein (DUF1015 family)
VPRIAPFEALIYDIDVAGPIERLTAPPYDVISESRRRAAREASPHSIVHVDLAEGSSDPGTPDNRYDRAAALLARWRAGGVLTRLSPSYLAYEMTFEDHPRAPGRVRGLLCAMTIEPWGGAILPHEQVMPGPIEDRLRLLRATRTHVSPIYGTIAGPCPLLGEALDDAARRAPLFEFHDREGVAHRVWQVSPDLPADVWVAREPLLIADGHHRYATALAYRDERRATGGSGPWDRVLALLVDAGRERVSVLPYHRVQRSGRAPVGGEHVADLASLLASLRDEELTYGTCTLEGSAPSYRLHRLDGDPPTVMALHASVLDGAVGRDDLTYSHEADAADRAVTSGEAVAAYFLPPTTPDRIRSVVERGERLPHKSTFFWPKPLTGLALMPLDQS